MAEDSIFSIDSLERLTRVLQDKILKTWAIPAITFTDDNEVYIVAPDRSEFRVTDMGQEFRVTIEKVR